MSDVPTQIINVEMGGGPQGASNPGPPGPAGTGFAPVAAVATGNVALTGIQNLDGVTGVAGQRVFLPYQTNPSQNGIWVQAAGAWSRPTDFATGTTPAAAVVTVTSGGNVYGRSMWVLLTTGVTIDTTNQVWQIVTTPNIRAAFHLGAAFNLPGSTDTLIPLDTVDYDFGGNFNTGTHRFTCPSTGLYRVNGMVRATGNTYSGTTGLFFVGFYQNAAILSATGVAGTGSRSSRLIQCTAGDTLGLHAWQNIAPGSYPLLTGNVTVMDVALERLTT